MAVELTEGSDRQPDVPRLGCGLAVLDIIRSRRIAGRRA
jgi:hypothetical protein